MFVSRADLFASSCCVAVFRVLCGGGAGCDETRMSIQLTFSSSRFVLEHHRARRDELDDRLTSIWISVTMFWMYLLGALQGPCTRRVFAAAVCASAPAAASHAFVAAPAIGKPFEWGSLWSSSYTGGAVAEPKRTGLRPADVAAILEDDLKSRKYILTGHLSPGIFADDCRFQDPNNAVTGLSKYRQALSYLFRAETSTVEDVRISVDPAGSIVAEYTASGELKLPWRPRISPWAGRITYTLDADDGLITSQVDVWNITRLDAVRQTFTPGV